MAEPDTLFGATWVELDALFDTLLQVSAPPGPSGETAIVSRKGTCTASSCVYQALSVTTANFWDNNQRSALIIDSSARFYGSLSTSGTSTVYRAGASQICTGCYLKSPRLSDLRNIYNAGVAVSRSATLTSTEAWNIFPLDWGTSPDMTEHEFHLRRALIEPYLISMARRDTPPDQSGTFVRSEYAVITSLAPNGKVNLQMTAAGDDFIFTR